MNCGLEFGLIWWIEIAETETLVQWWIRSQTKKQSVTLHHLKSGQNYHAVQWRERESMISGSKRNDGSGFVTGVEEDCLEGLCSTKLQSTLNEGLMDVRLHLPEWGFEQLPASFSNFNHLFRTETPNTRDFGRQENNSHLHTLLVGCSKSDSCLSLDQLDQQSVSMWWIIWIIHRSRCQCSCIRMPKSNRHQVPNVPSCKRVGRKEH